MTLRDTDTCASLTRESFGIRSEPQRTPDAGKTMGDREMLELAALAGGIRHIKYQNDYDGSRGIMRCDVYGNHMHTWNPRTNDGDALRLAVKLKIDVKHYDDHVVGWFDGGYIGTGKIMYGKDPYAATRLAITSAAAEVGRAMRDAGEHQ